MSSCLNGWGAQAGAMAEPQVPRPGKWFAWTAVLAGLLPSLWVAGVSLYMLIALCTARESLRTIGFLSALGVFLAVTPVGYWRVCWLCLAGRRVSAALWFGSALLILVWLAVYVWKLVNIGDAKPDHLVLMGLSLPTFALWIYALKRTY